MIQESGKKDTITVIRPAIAPLGPYNIPSNMAVSFTGLAVGLILGVILAFGLEMMDTSMGSVEDVEASLEAPVLGVIPHFDNGAEGKSKANRIPDSERTRDMIAHYDPASLVSEAFRYLRTNLQFVQLEKKSKIYLVTSSFVKEGKTFNAMNLGADACANRRPGADSGGRLAPILGPQDFRAASVPRRDRICSGRLRLEGNRQQHHGHHARGFRNRRHSEESPAWTICI